MSAGLQQRIDALLAEAAPLRDLDEDDPRIEPLAGLVDEINRLRARQDIEAREGRTGVDQLPRGDELTNACVEGSKALPPRRELEARATEAGIAFSRKIGDVKLAERLRAAGIDVLTPED